MKIIKKFWGISLTLVLIASLFLAVAPVSAADPLNWEDQLAPMGLGLFNVVAPGIGIADFDMNGSTAYAATGTTSAAGGGVYMSTNSGVWWTNITARLLAAGVVAGDSFDFVAIAPDDANIAAVATGATAGTINVYLTTNGGQSFSPMAVPAALTTINGIAISPVVSGGYRYVVAYGSNAGAPVVYYYNYGAGVGAWKEATANFTSVGFTWAVKGDPDADSVVAFAFSPGFAADYMAVAVMADDVAADTTVPAVADAVKLHQMSFHLGGAWNSEAGYPAVIYTAAADLDLAGTVNKVDVALDPYYDGADDASRIAYVGADITDATVAGQVGGVWRVNDSAAGVKIFGVGTPTAVYSVTADGTNLAVGEAATNMVYNSANPTAGAPTFTPARNMKRLGIDDAGVDNVSVLYEGGVLYGAKIGDGAAFSKSTDNGLTWNGISLIDDNYAAAGAGIVDIMVVGGVTYMSTEDTVTANVYKIEAGAVSRILCTAPGATYILRGLADDADIIYAADTVTNNIYYSADGGDARWFKRLGPAVPGDLAVESETVVYVGDATGLVYKSINSGFTWNTGVNSYTAAVNSMYVVAENQLVVGGAAFGLVSYSLDGAASFIPTGGTGFVTPVLVTASGLGEGDYIFAADTGSEAVARCVIGSTNPGGEFRSMNTPLGDTATPSVETNTGIELIDGVLYVLADDASGTATDGTYLKRTMLPTIGGTHAAGFWGTTFIDNGRNAATISDSLKATSTEDTVTLYAIDTTGITITYFQDTLVKNAPVVNLPAEGQVIQLTSAMMGTPQDVHFTWNRVSLATSYTLIIALDPTFTSVIDVNVVNSAAGLVSWVEAGGTFTPGTTYYWTVSCTTPLTSPGSVVRSFTIQQVAASVPQIGSPAVGATISVGTTPAFSWTPIAGATSYKLQVSTDPTFATTIYETETTAAGAMLPGSVTLTEGTTYFWRVKALSPNEGDWSTVANFTVAGEAAEPTETSTQPPLTITETNITQTTTTEVVEEVAPAYIWAIIAVGAILVIAVIVLIVRTRRNV